MNNVCKPKSPFQLLRFFCLLWLAKSDCSSPLLHGFGEKLSVFFVRTALQKYANHVFLPVGYHTIHGHEQINQTNVENQFFCHRSLKVYF